MAKTNEFKITCARYTGFKFLVDFQFKALGFRTCGKDAYDVTDGYTISSNYSGEITSTRNHHIEKYAYYRRHSAYPTNILLELARFLLFISRIVRKLCVVALPLTIVWAMLGIDNGEEPLAVVFSVYVLSWLATLALCVIAVGLRKLFFMDSRMDEICVRNGWKRYSQYGNK